LLSNKLEFHGLENKIEQGPNIIVANHSGAAKDVAAVYKAYERQLFFCAADYLLNFEYLGL
jgi:1-acyl-sn-glycerol-3-phosphate acyltransferase